MNQILFFQDKNEDKPNIPTTSVSKKKKNFFKAQFILCTTLALFCSLYYGYYLYEHNQKESLSSKIVENYNITRLYGNSISTSIEGALSHSTYSDNNQQFSVIGLIEINAIGISYPIISEINENLLKIAPCKFYGPMPNEVGNLCIAAHNYNNYKFFSRIKKLKTNDIISIYDLSGVKQDYLVYDSYETDSTDWSCTNQETDGKKEITLITCNNIQNRRRVVKAKQKDKS